MMLFSQVMSTLSEATILVALILWQDFPTMIMELSGQEDLWGMKRERDQIKRFTLLFDSSH